jgi:hypothetical protein
MNFLKDCNRFSLNLPRGGVLRFGHRSLLVATVWCCCTCHRLVHGQPDSLPMDYISSNRDGANRTLRSRILIGGPLVPFRLGLVSPIARRGVQFEVRRAELSILDIDMEKPYSLFAKNIIIFGGFAKRRVSGSSSTHYVEWTSIFAHSRTRAPSGAGDIDDEARIEPGIESRMGRCQPLARLGDVLPTLLPSLVCTVARPSSSSCPASRH